MPVITQNISNVWGEWEAGEPVDIIGDHENVLIVSDCTGYRFAIKTIYVADSLEDAPAEIQEFENRAVANPIKPKKKNTKTPVAIVPAPNTQQTLF